VPDPNQTAPTRSGEVAALLVASSLTVLAGAVVAPGLPGIRSAFSDVAGVETLSRLVLTVPALGVALLGGVAGRLGDRWGSRVVLLAGLVLYGLAGTTGLWLDTLPGLLVGRFLLGASVAAVMTSATALLAAAPGDRAQRLGLQAAFMGLGGLGFLAIGGALAETSWRGPFAVYGVAWLVVPAILAFVQDRGGASTSDAPAPDPAGGLRRVWPLVGFGALGMVFFYLVPVQGPFVLEGRFGASSTVVGAALGAMTVASAGVSWGFGKLRAVVSAPRLLMATFLAQGAGLAVFAAAPNLGVAGLGLVIVGMGTGLLMPNLNSWTAQLAPRGLAGRAIGRLTAGLFLGQFVSPLVVAPLQQGGLPLTTILGGCAVVAVGGAALVHVAAPAEG